MLNPVKAFQSRMDMNGFKPFQLGHNLTKSSLRFLGNRIYRKREIWLTKSDKHMLQNPRNTRFILNAQCTCMVSNHLNLVKTWKMFFIIPIFNLFRIIQKTPLFIPNMFWIYLYILFYILTLIWHIWNVDIKHFGMFFDYWLS